MTRAVPATQPFTRSNRTFKVAPQPSNGHSPTLTEQYLVVYYLIFLSVFLSSDKHVCPTWYEEDINPLHVALFRRCPDLATWLGVFRAAQVNNAGVSSVSAVRRSLWGRRAAIVRYYHQSTHSDVM